MTRKHKRHLLKSFNHQYPWFKVVVWNLVIILMITLAWGIATRHIGFSFVGEEKSETAWATHEVNLSEQETTELSQEEQTVLEKQTSRNYVDTKPENLKVQNLTGKKLIALTFDDGPSTSVTPQILDILKEKQAHATFFVIGKMAQAAPEILQREEKEGHTIGSHTMGHVNLSTLGVEEIKRETTAMDEMFQANLGHIVRLTRPPYGTINDAVKTGVQQPLIIWTIDPEDWRKTNTAEGIRKHVVEKAFDGAIILMHDIYGSTMEAVGGIIDELQKAGYVFVTVPELARARGVKLVSGEVYGSFRP